jgi:hypothetical protein
MTRSPLDVQHTSHDQTPILLAGGCGHTSKSIDGCSKQNFLKWRAMLWRNWPSVASLRVIAAFRVSCLRTNILSHSAALFPLTWTSLRLCMLMCMPTTDWVVDWQLDFLCWVLLRPAQTLHSPVLQTMSLQMCGCQCYRPLSLGKF